jgi:hypothetical protein
VSGEEVADLVEIDIYALRTVDLSIPFLGSGLAVASFLARYRSRP